MIDLDEYISLDELEVIDLTIQGNINYIVYNNSIHFDPSDLSKYKVIFTYSNN